MIANIICSIMVLVCMTDSHGKCINWQAQADVKGTIITQSADKYLVDFSDEAKTHPWSGLYDEVLVPKSDCVKLK